MSITAAQLIAEISVTGASKAQSDIAGMGTAVEGAGSKLGMLAGGIALAAGVALVGLGAKSVKMAGDFQESMTQLVTGAGESASNIKLVSDGILNMAVQTGTSTKQLSDGMYMIESAGFHGAAGLDVLKAAAMGAKVGNADLGTVADATTTILKDFGSTGISASGAVNTLIATVAAGKTHMADLSASLSQILPTASAAKVSLNDVMGAMATMTGEGVPAANAATYLRQTILGLDAPSSGAAKALKEVGLSSTQVATEMQKSLPGALKMITDAVGKKFPEGSAQYVEALKAIAGGSKNMQGILDLTGQHMKDFQANVGNVADAVKKGGSAINGWNEVTKDWNFRVSQAKEVAEKFGIQVGTALLPILTKAMGFLIDTGVPAVQKFASMIGTRLQPVFAELAPIVKNAVDGFERLFGATQKLAPVAKPLTDTFDRATAVFSKFQGVAAPLTDTFDRATGYFNKFNAAGKQTGEVVSPLKQVLDTVMQFGKAALNMSPLVNTIEGVARHGKELGEWWQQSVIPALHQAEPGFKNLGQALAGLGPAFLQVSNAVHGSFQKSFDALLPIFKQVVPLVIQLGGALAGGLGAAIKTVTPAFVAATTAVAQFSSDIATRVAPIVKGFFDEINKDMPLFKAIWNAAWPQISNSLSAAWNAMKGTVQIAWSIITGIIKVGLDVMSGNWKQAWEDVKSTLNGIWEGIKTIFKGGIDSAVNDFNRFKDGIIKAAQNLYDTLVGHSIIPDMINGIVSWFAQLPGRAMAGVNSLVSQVTTALNGLATSAFTAGAAVVNNVASGIRSAIGNVTSAIGSVAQAIADHLPHSPAKKGPLSKLNEFGPALVKTFADDIVSSSPKARAAAEHMVAQIADKLKAFPKEIAQARLDGNKTLAKALEQQKSLDDLIMRGFRDELTTHGLKLSNGLIVSAAKSAAGVGGSASNGPRAFVGRGGERLDFSGGTASVAGTLTGGSSSSGSSGQPIQVNVQVYLDGQKLTKQLMPKIVDAIRVSTGTHL